MLEPTGFVAEVAAGLGVGLREAELGIERWRESILDALRHRIRVSLPGLGTFLVREQYGRRERVIFKWAPELARRFDSSLTTREMLKPSPAWVTELPTLHAFIAERLASRRSPSVRVPGFGEFIVRTHPPAFLPVSMGLSPVPGHGPMGEWLVFTPAFESETPLLQLSSHV